MSNVKMLVDTEFVRCVICGNDTDGLCIECGDPVCCDCILNGICETCLETDSDGH